MKKQPINLLVKLDGDDKIVITKNNIETIKKFVEDNDCQKITLKTTDNDDDWVLINSHR